MQKLSIPRLALVAFMGLIMACSSTHQEAAKAPSSDDLLELLTGFGESISKRNFAKAVDYMVPEEKAMMMENGVVPPEKQKMLLALPLQKLIRHPAIRVDRGHIAGIYSVLPDLRKSDASMASNVGPDNGSSDSALISQDNQAAGNNSFSKATESNGSEEPALANNNSSESNTTDPMLKETVSKFFAAVNKKNWNGALALMNDDEKKLLLDDKGRLKDSSKQRLSQMDQKNGGALLMIDGKLSGVALLLP